MSGHSKWSTIKHKKAKVDSQRAVVFQKYSRELIVSARLGGPDPAGNFRLRTAIEKAKAAGLPNDNIKRAIEKGAGAGAADNYEELIYEGYAAGGVAVVVEAMTDNRNRTAGDVRHILDKFGGNLGTNGSVSWMFDKKGVIVIEKTATKLSEDELMLEILEAGADNMEADDEYYEITTKPEDFSSVREYLEGKGIEYLEAEVKMVPQNYMHLDEEGSRKMGLIVEKLEDLDDIQEIWHNWDEEE